MVVRVHVSGGRVATSMSGFGPLEIVFAGDSMPETSRPTDCGLPFLKIFLLTGNFVMTV